MAWETWCALLFPSSNWPPISFQLRFGVSVLGVLLVTGSIVRAVCNLISPMCPFRSRVSVAVLVHYLGPCHTSCPFRLGRVTIWGLGRAYDGICKEDVYDCLQRWFGLVGIFIEAALCENVLTFNKGNPGPTSYCTSPESSK